MYNARRLLFLVLISGLLHVAALLWLKFTPRPNTLDSRQTLQVRLHLPPPLAATTSPATTSPPPPAKRVEAINQAPQQAPNHASATPSRPSPILSRLAPATPNAPAALTVPAAENIPETKSPTAEAPSPSLDLGDKSKAWIGKIGRELRQADKTASPNTLAALANKKDSGHQLEKAISAAAIPRDTQVEDLVTSDGKRYAKYTGANGTYCVWPAPANNNGNRDATIGNCP